MPPTRRSTPPRPRPRPIPASAACGRRRCRPRRADTPASRHSPSPRCCRCPARRPPGRGAKPKPGPERETTRDLRERGMACILLWMQGGPSQFETWDPKPNHANGGETRAIATDVPGIQISEHLPRTAQVMSRLCVIRSMTSREGSHPRATFLMRTGYLPQASVKYPALGAQVAYHLGDKEFDLPSFVRIGRAANVLAKGGFLGVAGQHRIGDFFQTLSPAPSTDAKSRTGF